MSIRKYQILVRASFNLYRKCILGVFCSGTKEKHKILLQLRISALMRVAMPKNSRKKQTQRKTGVNNIKKNKKTENNVGTADGPMQFAFSFLRPFFLSTSLDARWIAPFEAAVWRTCSGKGRVRKAREAEGCRSLVNWPSKKGTPSWKTAMIAGFALSRFACISHWEAGSA